MLLVMLCMMWVVLGWLIVLKCRVFMIVIGCVFIEMMLWMMLLMLVVVFWKGLMKEGWLCDLVLKVMV